MKIAADRAYRKGSNILILSDRGVDDTGVDVGQDVSAQALLEQYDAVLLCCGAKKSRPLDTAGGVEGAYFAVDFLTASTKALLGGGHEELISAVNRDVVIVGGGDTGNDCVGTAIRMGCRSVVQLEMMPKAPDRRTEDNPWPQWSRVCKTDYGQEEAVAVFGQDPRRYQTTVRECRTDGEGRITSIITARLEPKRDNGRTVIAEVSGSEEELPCQLLLIAAGFLGPEDSVPDALGLNQNGCSNVATAPDGYATGVAVDKVFAAGDMRRGSPWWCWPLRRGAAQPGRLMSI